MTTTLIRFLSSDEHSDTRAKDAWVCRVTTLKLYRSILQTYADDSSHIDFALILVELRNVDSNLAISNPSSFIRLHDGSDLSKTLVAASNIFRVPLYRPLSKVMSVCDYQPSWGNVMCIA